jgi:hypothetical protein
VPRGGGHSVRQVGAPGDSARSASGGRPAVAAGGSWSS